MGERIEGIRGKEEEIMKMVEEAIGSGDAVEKFLELVQKSLRSLTRDLITMGMITGNKGVIDLGKVMIMVEGAMAYRDKGGIERLGTLLGGIESLIFVCGCESCEDRNECEAFKEASEKMKS